MNLKFYWGEVWCLNLSRAAKIVASELGLSRSSAYRRLRNGVTDFSGAPKRAGKHYTIFLENGDPLIGTAAEILSLAKLEFPGAEKTRVYRRLRRNTAEPLSLKKLSSPPMPRRLSARIGGRKTGRKTETLFSGVEGHDSPVGATALYHEWNPPIGRKELYIRLKAGYRRRADLTCRRLSMAEGALRPHRGRPRKDNIQSLAPEPASTAHKPKEAPILDIPTILERASAITAKNTGTLPPMRDYAPPKPYIRGT